MGTGAQDWLTAALELGAGASVRGAAVLALAWVITALMRRRSAAARHLVWTAGVAAALAMPVLVFLAPAWPVVPRGATHGFMSALPGLGTLERTAVRGGTQPAAAAASAPDDAVMSAGAVAAAVWLGGAAAGLAPLAIGAAALRRLERRSRPADDPVIGRLVAEATAELGLRRPPRALIARDDLAMPMAWGLVRGRVLLPRGCEGWPRERLRAVLLHEIGHIRRRDCATQALAHAARAVYWFNPLAWVAAWRMRVERERACDDLVLGAGVRGSVYAEELVAVAAAALGLGRRARLAAAAAAPMARGTHLRGRVREILDDRRDRRMVTMRQVLGVGLAVGAATLLAAAAQERHEPPAPKAPAAEQAERPKAEDDAWEKEPLYASMIRMRPVTQAIHSYAGKHDDHLPPDLGSLLAFIPEKDDDGRTRTPAERAAFFLSPRDAAKIKVPEKPTPEWVNANTSFVYLGKGDIVLAKVEDWGKASILHEKSGEGYPSPNPEMKGAPTFGVAFVDGHIEALLKADADKAIARGKEVLEAARPKQPQKPEPPKK